ncbi:nuclear transport factor 2 family protein [Microvirga sp. 17 mud 1-3]|uniref:nuclear transport factor 2 family protein n=1 Tax=Microvirga sp. 17 mud 1-3 TaxID=2082949 RepID=UPI000D6BE1C1|nr:nuclear transport factor 2 family protein [Microvirga sp. 17 mud 1-3]AWM86628.1 polyketide cyclase [Microvirga sp. 17 mud 1-3]
MTDATAIADRYIAAWNETDPDMRRRLLSQIWTEDGTYRDPLMQGEGLDQIDTLIAAVHERFPTFRFALTGTPDGYGDCIRFSWELGPEGADGIVKGTDFATLQGGRLKTVAGFLDQVPAQAPAEAVA